MRPPFGYIPRLYAPLRLSTRQSFGPSPALAAAIIATATTSTRRLTFKSRMSTSSGPQSTTMWSAAGQGEGEEERKLNGGDGTGSHREHHPTESTSPAPKKTTSNAPAEASPNTSGADSSQRQPHSQGDDQGLAGAQRRDGPLALPPLPEGYETSSAVGGNSAGGGVGGGDNNNKGVSSSSGSNTITLDMSGGDASTKLDHLGPLVVNQDGTMSRISNWGEMTEIERRNTLRILGKRNQLRLATLRGEKEKNGAEAGK
ncbi:uncharacterized protein CCOS01_02812 [Colletotrichum costaricense]|uniref:Uncharacterized protein n=1 Tax=Colletotrichum costaricense TaxID=1209916 RepID=A0AAI9Z5D5_9PEZI|nr:uncharacterized protein CCOS01_02812 [Colletotrichum costaricense]KAK1534060.1 hypothetical protein CCOS01_02812 [Colletotrichum costaricense]